MALSTYSILCGEEVTMPEWDGGWGGYDDDWYSPPTPTVRDISQLCIEDANHTIEEIIPRDYLHV